MLRSLIDMAIRPSRFVDSLPEERRGGGKFPIFSKLYTSTVGPGAFNSILTHSRGTAKVQIGTQYCLRFAKGSWQVQAA